MSSQMRGSIRLQAEGEKERLKAIHREFLVEVATSLVRGSPAVASLPNGSPVDTGHFVHNWQFGIGYVPQNEIEGTDPGRSATLAKLTQMIRLSLPGGFVYFANMTPYAAYLERGHSKQAPSGMIRVTAGSVPAMLARAESRVNDRGVW